MDRARIHEGIRRMRFSSILERSERSEFSRMEAAELVGSASARSGDGVTGMCRRGRRVWRTFAEPLAAACAGGRDRADAGAVSRALSRLYGQACPRAAGQTASVNAGLHGDQAAPAAQRPGTGRDEALNAPQEAATLAADRHDAASGRLDACLAARPGRQTGPGGDHG